MILSGFTSTVNSSISLRWASVKLNNLSNLRQQLEQYVEAGQLNPQMTIAQLVGGKLNNNKFGNLSAKMANRQGQISRRGGTAN